MALEHQTGPTNSNTKNENGEHVAEPVKPMDPERRRWLQEAIESQILDPIEEMKKAIDIIKNADLSEESKIDACGKMVEYVDNYDLARDFEKIGGVDMLISRLFHDTEGSRDLSHELEVKMLEVLSTLAQNHPEVQAKIDAKGGLKYLVSQLQTPIVEGENNETDSYKQAHVRKTKIVTALGSMVRGNTDLTKKFLVEYKSFAILVNTLKLYMAKTAQEVSEEVKRLLRKILFLVLYFVEELEGVRGIVSNHYRDIMEYFSNSNNVEDVDINEGAAAILKRSN